MTAVVVSLLGALAAWAPGDAEFAGRQGIGGYAEMSDAIRRVDEEARGWLDGMEHATGFRERQLEAAACKLWCFTASPEPLDDVPPFTLGAPGRWAAVAEGYRQLVREAEEGGVPFDTFVRRNLRATAGAGGGPRDLQASSVLFWWIRYEGGNSLAIRRESPVSSLWMHFPAMGSAARRRAVHRVQVSWFERHRRQLTWDAANREFTGPRGAPLPDPNPRAELKALTAEEKARGDSIPDGRHLHRPRFTDGLPEVAGPAEAGAATPPIVYTPYLRPEPLADGQIRDVLRLAAALQPKGRPVWFVLVLGTQQLVRGPELRAVVYYAPDQGGGRVRKGRCAYVGLGGGSLGRYAQVAAAGELHDDELAAPADPELPMRWPPTTRRGREPVAVDDADLLELVDLARTALAEAEDAGEQPILSLEVEDGDFVVRTGWSVGRGAGQGYRVRIKHTGGRYKVAGVTFWAS